MIHRYRGSSSCPRLFHGRCTVAGEECDLSPSLLHVLHRQPLHQVHLLLSMAQTSGTLLTLDPAGKCQVQAGEHHRPRQQVTSYSLMQLRFQSVLLNHHRIRNKLISSSTSGSLHSHTQHHGQPDALHGPGSRSSVPESGRGVGQVWAGLPCNVGSGHICSCVQRVLLSRPPRVLRGQRHVYGATSFTPRGKTNAIEVLLVKTANLYHCFEVFL